MGNWKNRRPRRFFYQTQYKDPASSYYEPDEPPPPHQIQGFAEDGVPSWEKRFCYLVGLVPWQKIVNCKNFMYCHGSVVNWDDSAGEEAFQSAKKRFWAEVNGLPCEISLPDPDMYIDNINWNPDIDTDLIKDLERAFFAIEEGENDGRLEHKSKKTRNFTSVPSEGWNRNPVEAGTPWECGNNIQSSVELKSKAQCWNQWHVSTNDPSNLNNGDNPWDRCSAQENKVAKCNAWTDGGDKLQGWNHNGNHANQLQNWDNNLNNVDNSWKCSYHKGNDGWNNSRNQVSQSDRNSGGNHWEHSNQSFGHVKDKAWDNFDCSSWGNKLQDPGSSWHSNFTQGSGTWKGRQSRGWKQWDNPGRGPKDLEFRQAEGGGWGTWNNSHRKREGTEQYLTGNKHTRFQGNSHQTSHHWRGRTTNKRVGFSF